ncbi:hypothetical protein GCM10020260_14890 [Nesterenkonia halobia]|uniref:Uncharacterized protein n=1 Tax=Nesterenkonia halobia TaxID=37922 RepID=A0ABP6RE42_9MICC
MIVLAVLLVLGVRVLLARQGRRLNRRIEDAVTPENARTAALALTDEQHREVYRAIAAEDGRRALATFKQATGAGVRDCIIAVQALHQYPQRTPSELRLEDELSGVSEGPEVREELVEDAIDEVRDQPDDQSDDQASGGTGDQDDDAGADAGTDAGADESRDRRRDQDDDGGPVAEADPYTGRILGPNEAGIPDIPGGERQDDRAARDEDQTDATPEDDESADRPESETSPGAADGEPAEDPEVEEKARRLLAESEFSLDEELTVPEEWTRQDAQEEPAGFHLEVQREGEKITLSHEDLEPWVHDQLYALLRDDHVTEAAQLLSEHSPLTEDEAHKFLVVFKNQG